MDVRFWDHIIPKSRIFNRPKATNHFTPYLIEDRRESEMVRIATHWARLMRRSHSLSIPRASRC